MIKISKTLKIAILLIPILLLSLVWVSQLLGLISFLIVTIVFIFDLFTRKKMTTALTNELRPIIVRVVGFLIFFVYMINIFNLFDFINLEPNTEFIVLVILFSLFGFLRFILYFIFRLEVFYNYLSFYLIVSSLLFIVIDTISNGKLGIIGAFFTAVIAVLGIPDIVKNAFKISKNKIRKNSGEGSE